MSNAISHNARLAGTGQDYYESALISCPRCGSGDCTVRIGSLNLLKSRNGHKHRPMFHCWTACGWAFDMRIDTGGGGAMELVIINVHQRRDYSADPDSLTVIDPPPFMQQYFERAS